MCSDRAACACQEAGCPAAESCSSACSGSHHSGVAEMSAPTRHSKRRLERSGKSTGRRAAGRGRAGQTGRGPGRPERGDPAGSPGGRGVGLSPRISPAPIVPGDGRAQRPARGPGLPGIERAHAQGRRSGTRRSGVVGPGPLRVSVVAISRTGSARARERASPQPAGPKRAAREPSARGPEASEPSARGPEASGPGGRRPSARVLEAGRDAVDRQLHEA